ncbi:hypothetical protein Ancab_019000 [Ancistrocladus abbreviatus]
MERENTTIITPQTPLLQTIQVQQQRQQQNQRQQVNGVVPDDDDDHSDTCLDKTLQLLDFWLSFLGFHQTTLLSFGLSWTAFLLVGVAVPVIILELCRCSGHEKYQIKDFQFDVLASQASLGAVSLLCVSYNLRKYGIRKFLFVDRYSGHVVRFMDKYIQKIRVASQFVTLVQITAYSGTVTFLNSGDFAVTSIVQVVGITLCLHAATRISHRAQGLASVASKWHAMATCSSSEGSQSRHSYSVGSLDTSNHYSSLPNNDSESDLDSLDYAYLPTTMRLASFLSSYLRRQSFVTYLQTNPGGITIFGWTVDRALISTIFFIELSLVLFVLGRTVLNSSGQVP